MSNKISNGRKATYYIGLGLDPDKAREDLSPYSHAAGKMINDVVSEVDALKGTKGNLEQKRPDQIIKIKWARMVRREEVLHVRVTKGIHDRCDLARAYARREYRHQLQALLV